MATIARDNGSSYRARGIRVRDARHVHNGPDVCAQPAPAKNTKRWCGGKRGRAHVPVAGDEKTLGKGCYSFSGDWLVLYCSKCGKELDHWSPPLMITVVHHDGTRTEQPIFDRPKPEWAEKFLAERLDKTG